MNVLAQSTNKEVTKLALVSQPASFPSQPSAEQCTVRCYFTGLYGMQLVERAQLQLIVTLDDDQSAPTTRAMASSVAAHLAARHPNDVRFYFPRCERELWANSAFLLEKSPYFKDLFASGFAEGTLKKERTKLESEDEAARRMSTFDDSDDDTDSAPDSISSSPAKTEEGECGSAFREIVVTETAFTTYRALLVYLQTEHLEFAPLLSSFNDLSPPSEVTQRRHKKVTTPRPDGVSLPLPASPKSIYRLAHLLSLPDLSAQALASLSSQLTPSNVLYELFDPVSGAYDEVQKLELAYAIKHWKEVKGSPAMLLAEKRVELGELGHPVGMLLQLAKSLN